MVLVLLLKIEQPEESQKEATERSQMFGTEHWIRQEMQVIKWEGKAVNKK